MKRHNGFLTVVVSILLLSSILLNGCMYAIAADKGDEKPYNLNLQSGVTSDGRLESAPLSQAELQEKYGVYLHAEDGKSVTVFSEEQYAELKAARDGGTRIPLTYDEILFLVNDSINLYFTYDEIRLTNANRDHVTPFLHEQSGDAFTIRAYNMDYSEYGSYSAAKQAYSTMLDDIYEIIYYRLYMHDAGFSNTLLNGASENVPVLSIDTDRIGGAENEEKLEKAYKRILKWKYLTSYDSEYVQSALPVLDVPVLCAGKENTFSIYGPDVYQTQRLYPTAELFAMEPQNIGKHLYMTVAETVSGCAVFEYRDEKPYCFYAYDTQGNLFRVLCADFEGINENDLIAVEFGNIEKLSSDFANGYDPQYEINATHLTLKSANSASCVSSESGKYTLTLPNSGRVIGISKSDIRFVPYIDDELVRAAEAALTEQAAEYGNDSVFYLRAANDRLYLAVKVINQPENSDGNSVGDNAWVYFEECISSQAVEAEFREAGVRILQYNWDGWGITCKTVEACDTAYVIIQALDSMMETGEIVEKISDDVLRYDGGVYPVETGTMWIETDNRIYRITRGMTQICRVKAHFGEGRVLEMSDEFISAVRDAWNYVPFDYYKGTYKGGDRTFELKHVFQSESSVQLSVLDINVEDNYDPHNTIIVELISNIDQIATIYLDCRKSDDNLAEGDNKIVKLTAGVPVTVGLTFGGWKDYGYRIYLGIDYTRVQIAIEPGDDPTGPSIPSSFPGCLTGEDGQYTLTLPESGKKIKLDASDTRFVPFITYNRVKAAEESLTQQVSEYSDHSDFYLRVVDDYLCLAVEVIKSIDPPVFSGTDGEYTVEGCGFDHEHIFFTERISSRAVK